ncbi:MAG: uroporphyrinogen-III synthase [Gemmatimonadaceae bacterium]
MLDPHISRDALRGRRVVITRPSEQAAGLAEACRSLGAEAIIAPAIAIVEPVTWAPLDEALARLDLYAWLIVTSVHAARAVRARVRALDIADRLTGVRLAAVGPATAAALPGAEPGRVLVSSEQHAQALADEIPDVAGKHILFPRGDRAREFLPQRLRSRGATVDDPIAYRTIPGEGLGVILGEIAAERCDALVLTSPSTVEFVASALTRRGLTLAERASRARPALFCIGPTTADAVRQLGVEPQGVAAGSAEGLSEIMSRWFANGVTG